MTVIKRRYTANFTTIGNSLFDDERLAADEVGILAYLRSRPHDWEVRRPALGRRWNLGRDAIKRVITNLVRTGWCVARKDRLANGTFFMIYEIRDEPGPTLTDEEVRRALSLVSSEPASDESDGIPSPNIGGDQHRATGEPPTPNPSLADPSPADPPLANISIPNKELPKTDSKQIGGGSAREPLVSNQANALAEQLLVIAGHDPKFWPPGWCGAAMRVQTWLSSGWPPEIILAATKGRMARRDGIKPESVRFFEKVIAEEVARQAAPLPVVEVRPAETIRTSQNAGSQGNIIQAADRLVAKLASFDDDGTGGRTAVEDLRGGAGAAVVRLLPQR